MVFLSRDFSGRFREVVDRLLGDNAAVLPSEPSEATWQELSLMIGTAKQEWLDAQGYFNEAIEPELVDHAILTLQAAERKYMYWLEQIKNLD